MLALATQNLASIQHPGTSFVRSSYADAEPVLQTLGIEPVDRVLLDLGLSSDQLSDRERGFGFDAGGPLDMRFHPHENKPVSELLRTLDRAELERIFREFGEEPAAAKVASEMVDADNLEIQLSPRKIWKPVLLRQSVLQRTRAAETPQRECFRHSASRRIMNCSMSNAC